MFHGAAAHELQLEVRENRQSFVRCLVRIVCSCLSVLVVLAAVLRIVAASHENEAPLGVVHAWDGLGAHDKGKKALVPTCTSRAKLSCQEEQQGCMVNTTHKKFDLQKTGWSTFLQIPKAVKLSSVLKPVVTGKTLRHDFDMCALDF